MKISTSMFINNLISLLLLTILFNVMGAIFPNSLFMNSIISLIVVSVLTLIIKAIVYRVTIKNPIIEITKTLKEIEDGDISLRFENIPNNEMGIIKENVNAFLNGLENTILNINDVSSKLANNSLDLDRNLHQIVQADSSLSIRGVKDSMESIVNMVTSQTAETEEIFASLTEISSMINSVSENVGSTRGISKETTELAKMGGSKVAESLQGMIDIQNTVKNIEEKAHNLGESSSRVGQIVGIINGISEQTNLLALNAAIEAARAGEAGRGFAVVADEVRKLAENSKKSTQEISSLINIIQQEVYEVISAVNTGYEKAKHGTELAQDTYKNIETIIKKVETTDNKMEEISTAMKEQALATNEINVTMETIANNSTEINHLSMQHNEALDSVSEYLNGSLKNVQVITVVSDALNNLVQVFTVDKGKKATEINAIPWKNKYSVSVTSIDDQHKQLVNLINELNNAMLYEKGRDKISQIIKGLVDYTVFHFDYEEGLLKKNGYNDFDNHKKIHTKFIDAIKDFQNDFEYNEKELSKEVMDFLKRWLIEHIMGTDQKYSELLVKNKQN